MIEILAIPAFSDNYIWLLVNRKQQSAIVVDPGQATPVLDKLQQEHLSLSAILITHHHHDHTGGIQDIVAAHPAPVYEPQKEPVYDGSISCQEGDTVMLDGFPTFEVLDIPGHTAGHIAYYSKPYLFCGDTLFLAGCGRLFEGTAEQMYNSLKKLSSLPNDTLIYCAHEYTEANLTFAKHIEPKNEHITQRIKDVQQLRAQNYVSIPAPLSQEKKTNPFLRVGEENLQQAARDFLGHLPANPIETFAAIRKLKDQF